MSKKDKITIVRCPICRKKDNVGFLRGKGIKKYFCSDCCVEFNTEKGKIVSVYSITECGSAIPIDFPVQK